jgi:23S rRNA pseudouridine2605 synthase
MTDKSPPKTTGERIAKVIARAGLASRREAEAWIAAGRVAVNGTLISSPALNVTPADRIAVDGAPLRARERTRLFLYHKPRGLVTTHSDPEGRDTIFRALPKSLPRLISVGRLDINTEALDRLHAGITIDGVRYGPIEATLDREQGANVWLTFGIREGKNREVRKVLETLGLRVNRLIRVAFGPFELGDLDDGAVKEIDTADLRARLGERIVTESGADFDAPPASEDAHTPSRRHTELPAREPRGPHHRRGKRKPHRRDRSGGPRPKHPRPR